MRRVIDVLLAALGLAVASPVLAVVAVAVRLDNPGPVFFRQVRVGRHGQLFEICKFRTMRPSSEGPQVTSSTDARITRVGRWLRSSKLDELPQLLNVLAGDMSLVGPRPEVPEYVALWDEQARREILSVRPGITDPASIEFRRESELLAAADDPDYVYRQEILPRKVAAYREYVANRSLLRDLKILMATVNAVVAK